MWNFFLLSTIFGPLLFEDGKCVEMISKYNDSVCGIEPVPIDVPSDVKVSESGTWNANVSKPGAWPWMAAVAHSRDMNKINWFCGGALISDNLVITAASCLHHRHYTNYKERISPEELVVFLGDGIFSGSHPHKKSFRVMDTFIHPFYAPEPNSFYSRGHGYDMAIVCLKERVKFTNQIRPICIPPYDLFKDRSGLNEEDGVLIEWVYKTFDDPMSYYLRELKMPVLPDGVCEVRKTQFCAKYRNFNNETQQTSYGGPFMLKRGDRWTLMGIVRPSLRIGPLVYVSFEMVAANAHVIDDMLDMINMKISYERIKTM